MSGYHSIRAVLPGRGLHNLLITKQPMDLYFKPQPGGFKDDILRVAPDILPPGSVRSEQVWIDGEPYTNFDAEALTVKLPDDANEQVRVEGRRLRAGSVGCASTRVACPMDMSRMEINVRTDRSGHRRRA